MYEDKICPDCKVGMMQRRKRGLFCEDYRCPICGHVEVPEVTYVGKED